jgi:poly(A) polymerase
MNPAATERQRALATAIVRQLRQAGFAAFWVGGCVRDLLLDRVPEDYDIATSARPEQVEALFARTRPVGRAFGVLLVAGEGVHCQVATFRAEADYADGRRPSRVRFADAKADARRRDFTINGLFYDPLDRTVHDWVDGRADLERRLVRTIGSPSERLSEDYLRLLRAVRFAAQLDFAIAPPTFQALQQHAASLQRVSAERIRDELLRLFRPPHAARALDLLRDSHLLAQVMPEVDAFRHCAQSPPYHPEGSVYEHARRMLELLPPEASPALPWAALLHDIGKPAVAQPDPATGENRFLEHERVGARLATTVLERLRFPRKQIDEIVAAVRLHMQFKDVRQMKKSTLRRLLLRPTFPLELELHRLDCLGSHGRLDHYEFLLAQAGELARQPAICPPLVTGRDLLALGWPPGPALGALLAEIRELQLSDALTTREAALAWARQHRPGTRA